MSQTIVAKGLAPEIRDRAFAVLEKFAREHTRVFEDGKTPDPAEVVQAMLLAPLGLIRVRFDPPPDDKT